MPRAFTPSERTRIRRKLLEAGLKRFAAEGIRKARIEEIAADAGIAKGSFYAFFGAKHALFMAIGETREAAHRAAMRQIVDATSGRADERLGQLFDLILDRIETDPVLRIVRDRAELEYLLRALPPDHAAKNAESDRAFLKEFAAHLRQSGAGPSAHAEDIAALMTLMLALSLQRDLIAAPEYSHCVALMRQSFISRLSTGEPT